MMRNKYKDSGTVLVGVVLLIIAGLIVLSIVRFFWVDTANDYYDKLISSYIEVTADYDEGSRDELKKRLLENGIFIKMHKWDRESFVKDKQLYNEMIKKHAEQQRRREEAESGIIETLINL